MPKNPSKATASTQLLVAILPFSHDREKMVVLLTMPRYESSLVSSPKKYGHTQGDPCHEAHG